MRIKKIVAQHRRGFTAIYECDRCGKTADENYRTLTTKHPGGVQL